MTSLIPYLSHKLRSMKQTLFLFILFAFTMLQRGFANGEVVINEVMQSNIDYLMVDDDFPDSWVELYNTTRGSINLNGWRIGTKEDFATCYALPSVTIAAGGHIVVYCDKENNGMHTDFRVDSGKGNIFLYNASGVLVDELTLAKMPSPNVAYGRVTDGNSEWHYKYVPTAGKANGSGGAKAVLPQPLFNVTGGVFTSAPSQWLSITMPEGSLDDWLIFYTLDGTEPTTSSARGKVISMPINKTFVIRAKILSTSGNAVPSRSVTQSYIFHPRMVTMPVISITSNRDYFYDSRIGILTSNVNDGVPNYMRTWRRPVNVEYYTPEGTMVFNQLAETAVSGATTRELPQKSMKLYANKRFGTKSFASSGETCFWKDKPGIKSVKSFIIRNGGNNSMSSRINDAFVQILFGPNVDNMDWQAYQPVIVYLNGTYLGEFGMRERSDEDYVESNFSGLEDIEMADENSYQKPDEGSHFADFYNIYHDPATTYAVMDQQMDFDNFIPALACEIYGMNTDFPTNNVSMWRALPFADGEKADPIRSANQRWRWIVKDVDRFGMSLTLYPQSFDMIRYLFSPDDLMFSGMNHFDLYKKLNSMDDFRMRFVKSMAVYLGDFLKPENVCTLLDQMKDEIADEVRATMSVYNGRYSDFTNGISSMKRTALSRNDNIYKQMADYYNLGSLLPVRVYVDDDDVSINDIRLTTGDFEGYYFPRIPFTISTACKNHSWRLTVMHSDLTITQTDFHQPEVTVNLINYMNSSNDVVSVEWSLSDDTATAIQNINDAPSAVIYDLQGMGHKSPVKGINIIGGRKIVY